MNERVLLVFFLLALSRLCSQAWAESSASCPELRLDAADAAMAHVPVVDQQDFGICYSAVAVQMIDAWRFSHGDKDFDRHSSMMAAALDAAEDPARIVLDYPFPFPMRIDGRRDDIEGGSASDVLDFLREHGACDQRRVAGGADMNGVKSAFAQLGPYYDRYRKLEWRAAVDGLTMMNPAYFIDYRRAEKEWKELDRRGALVATDLASCLRDMGVPLDQIPTLKELERYLSERKQLAFLADSLTRGCRGHRYHPGTPDSHTYGKGSTSSSKYRKKIQALLDRGNPQPVGVSFCSNLLYHPKYRGLDRGAWFNTHDGDCGEHVALVIGQRFNGEKKRCEYLMRNSWGPGCLYAWDCESGGNIWLDRDALLDNTYGLTWLGD